jgi:hypothetical protein
MENHDDPVASAYPAAQGCDLEADVAQPVSGLDGARVDARPGRRRDGVLALPPLVQRAAARPVASAQPVGLPSLVKCAHSSEKLDQQACKNLLFEKRSQAG